MAGGNGGDALAEEIFGEEAVGGVFRFDLIPGAGLREGFRHTAGGQESTLPYKSSHDSRKMSGGCFADRVDGRVAEETL